MPPKERIVYVILISAFCFGVGYFGARRMRQPPKIVIQTSDSSTPWQAAKTSSAAPSLTSAGSVVIHVVGAVHHPGLVTLDAGSRIKGAVKAAGGATSDADLEAINLAAKVEDGQQIAVPRKGALIGDHAAPATHTSSGKHPPAPIDLNTAGEAELEELPGIGPAMAAKIVEYRKQHGGIGSVDDLRAIRGLGDKKIEKIRPWVRP